MPWKALAGRVGVVKEVSFHTSAFLMCSKVFMDFQQECLCGGQGWGDCETLEALPALEFHPQGCVGFLGSQFHSFWGYFWSVRSVGQSEAGTAPSEGGESLGQDALRRASPQDPRTRTTVFWLPWVGVTSVGPSAERGQEDPQMKRQRL